MSLIYECVVCNKKSTSEKAAEIEASACCMPCALDHNHPGKFSQYSTGNDEDFMKYYSEAMGTALILYEWSMNSGEDEFMSNEGWGYLARFGEYHLQIDSQGFVSYEKYKNEEQSIKEYEKLYRSGWGASEEDIYVVNDYHRGWAAWQDGKEIPCWARSGYEYDNHAGIDRQRVLAAVSLHMRKTGFFPDIWEESDHGTLTCISEEVW
jgi:hypothetical protein